MTTETPLNRPQPTRLPDGTIVLTRWCVHKLGSDQLGALCSFKEEADDLLHDLNSDLISMPSEEKAKYVVIEVEVKFREDEPIAA